MVFEATARAVWEGASRFRGIPTSGSATLPTDNLIFIHREGYGSRHSFYGRSTTFSSAHWHAHAT